MDDKKNIYKFSEDGKLDGFFESYYENGQLNYKQNYKDGIRDGLFYHYYENGQLSYKLCYLIDEQVDISYCEK